MNRRIFFHPERCMLCFSCVLACQMDSVGTSEIQKIPQDREPMARLTPVLSRGTPWIWTCRHCTSAPCVEACVSGSLRQEEGKARVIHQSETCVGCGSCILVCPYGALKFDSKEGRVSKCNLCAEEEVPPCVKVCEAKALICQEPDLFAREKKKRYAREIRSGHEVE